jgi:hypothetical protein
MGRLQPFHASPPYDAVEVRTTSLMGQVQQSLGNHLHRVSPALRLRGQYLLVLLAFQVGHCLRG